MSDSMSPTPPPTPPPGGETGPIDESGAAPERSGGVDRVEATFNSAVERPTAERLRFVDEACKDGAELRDRVRRLLEAHERAGEKT
jgi:hypothetical protein